MIIAGCGAGGLEANDDVGIALVVNQAATLGHLAPGGIDSRCLHCADGPLGRDPAGNGHAIQVDRRERGSRIAERENFAADRPLRARDERAAVLREVACVAASDEGHRIRVHSSESARLGGSQPALNEVVRPGNNRRATTALKRRKATRARREAATVRAEAGNEGESGRFHLSDDDPIADGAATIDIAVEPEREAAASADVEPAVGVAAKNLEHRLVHDLLAADKIDLPNAARVCIRAEQVSFGIGPIDEQRPAIAAGHVGVGELEFLNDLWGRVLRGCHADRLIERHREVAEINSRSRKLLDIEEREQLSGVRLIRHEDRPARHEIVAAIEAADDGRDRLAIEMPEPEDRHAGSRRIR